MCICKLLIAWLMFAFMFPVGWLCLRLRLCVVMGPGQNPEEHLLVFISVLKNALPF